VSGDDSGSSTNSLENRTGNQAEREELFYSHIDYRRRMGIRFIGHKKRLLSNLLDEIDNTVDDDVNQVADLFAGTGAVSAGLKRKGYRVIANDILTHCCVLTRAQLLNSQAPSFETLLDSHPEITEVTNTFVVQTEYAQVLSYLNNLTGRRVSSTITSPRWYAGTGRASAVLYRRERPED